MKKIDPMQEAIEMREELKEKNARRAEGLEDENEGIDPPAPLYPPTLRRSNNGTV